MKMNFLSIKLKTHSKSKEAMTLSPFLKVKLSITIPSAEAVAANFIDFINIPSDFKCSTFRGIEIDSDFDFAEDP